MAERLKLPDTYQNLARRTSRRDTLGDPVVEKDAPGAENRPNFGPHRPFWATFGPTLAEVRSILSTVGRCGSNLGRLCDKSSQNLDKRRQTLVRFCQNCVFCLEGAKRPSFGQLRPDCPTRQFGSNLGRVSALGATCSTIVRQVLDHFEGRGSRRNCSTTIGHLLGKTWTTSGPAGIVGGCLPGHAARKFSVKRRAVRCSLP